MSSDLLTSFKFSNSEAKILRELSSFDFGFINFNISKGQIKKQILEKAINCLDNSLSKLVEKFKEKKDQEQSELKTSGLLTTEKQLEIYDKVIKLLDNSIDPYIYLFLGHYQLLLYLYEDALSAYLEFESRDKDCWKNIQFIYGLAICYFHFNALDKSIELFQKILYLQPNCCRSKEIHIRLGYIYKLNTNFDCSLRHFRQALNDSCKGSFSEIEIRFQIAHLLEVCGKFKQAQKAYEQLISICKEDAPDHIKHLCYRQLGWLSFSGNIGKSNSTSTPGKKDSVISLLQQAISFDDSSGKTWYLLGRAQARENKVQEAFMAYRNSIDKTEANADTWCSIGVLYQEQNQPMDALQAYFCACQLDRKHVAAWTNLGVLYESMGQYKDALKCYQNAISSDKINEVRIEIKERMMLIQKLLTQLPEKNIPNQLIPPNQQQQQKVSQIRPPPPPHQTSNTIPVGGSVGGPSGALSPSQMMSQSMVMKLPTVDEAWNLPIPTELTQRQMQLEMQEAVASASSAGGMSRIFAHHSSNYLSSGSGNVVSSDIAIDPSGSKRRRIAEGGLVGEELVAPLTQQQTQLLVTLESQSAQLNNQQRQTMVFLQNQLQRYQFQKEQQQQQSKLFGNNSMTGTNNPLSMCVNNNNSGSTNNNNSMVVISNSGSSVGTPNCSTVSSLCDSVSFQKDTRIVSNSSDKGTVSSSVVTNTTSNSSTNNNSSNNQDSGSIGGHNEDMHLIQDLDEIPEDYSDDIMVNLDALLNDPMGNFDEHFDDSNGGGCVSSNSVCGNKAGNNNHTSSHNNSSGSTNANNANPINNFNNNNSNQLVGEQDENMKDEPEYPVTDLLSYLRMVEDEKLPTIDALQEMDILMTGSQIIDKVTKLSSTNHNMWSFTYLPGNRIPHPPVPPPLITTIPDRSSSSSDSNNFNNNGGGGGGTNNSSISRQNTEYFQLLPPTPSVYLDCKKDVHSPELRQFCLSQPVVVIRNLAATLRMDLGMFSTKVLVETNPNHKIEQRIQDLQPPDENKDLNGKTTLRCMSSKSTTSIQEYANYQARMFVEAKKEEKAGNANSSLLLGAIGNSQSISNGQSDDLKYSSNSAPGSGEEKKKRRKIYFGTNCDLSDESKWFAQLHELTKLPNFLKVVSACNMLSHCGFTIMGMNSVQLYMKVPGSRTPGHQENNNFCSININVGPGDCEWFSVPEQYWGAINTMCEENKIDYLTGSWWPNLEELKQRQIPVYRFIQRPGDLVWINAGTVHWVQAIGWCNNVAWNVGPLISRQYSLSMERYEYNKLKMYKSIVSMVHLSWQLAKNIKMTDSHLYQLIKYTLMVSLIHCTLTWNFLEKARVAMVLQSREENEHTHHCVDCECEVFNIFLIKQIKTNPLSKKGSKEVKYETRCLNCALKMNQSLTSFKAIYQYKLSELVETYDAFKYKSSPIAAYLVNR